jgi:hypothetical protein
MPGGCVWDTEIAVRRLVIRPGGIGDVIVSLPALECLRTGYLEVWTAAPNVPLIRFADKTRAISSTGLDMLGIGEPPASLLGELRGFDSIVSWYGCNRPDFRDLIDRLDLPFTFFRALPPDQDKVHATDFYLDQIRTLTHCSADGIPRIPCNAERQGFAVIHPFSGSAKKNWPLEKFGSLAKGLERVMPVSWLRGREDPPLAGAVQIENLYDVACWLARARLYVGNDSGITHLAAAVGSPVLALFGPTNPAVWGPRGPNVRIVRWN